jgi:hypothetical protein
VKLNFLLLFRIDLQVS